MIRWFPKQQEAVTVIALARAIDFYRIYHQIWAFGGKRGRGRPKKCLEEVVREDLRVTGLTEDMAQDRRLWRDRIKVSECRGLAA